MPKYGDLPKGVGATTAGPTALSPGDRLTLFNDEALVAPQASIVFNRALGRTDGDAGVTFFIEFAGAIPTDSVVILGSNKAPAAVFTAADWVYLFTSNNKQQDAYTDTGRFEYYCAFLASQSAGGNLTVIAKR